MKSEAMIPNYHYNYGSSNIYALQISEMLQSGVAIPNCD